MLSGWGQNLLDSTIKKLSYKPLPGGDWPTKKHREPSLWKLAVPPGVRAHLQVTFVYLGVCAVPSPRKQLLWRVKNRAPTTLPHRGRIPLRWTRPITMTSGGMTRATGKCSALGLDKNYAAFWRFLFIPAYTWNVLMESTLQWWNARVWQT